VVSPAVVLALVLLMTGVGTSVLVWSWPTFGKVRRGYELLAGGTAVLLVLAGRAAVAGPVRRVLEDDPSSTVAPLLPLATAAVLLGAAALVLRMTTLPPTVSRVTGLASAVAGLALLVPLAGLRAERGGAGGFAQGLVELLLGAALLGSIWFGMLLGHWYLVERRLSNRPMVVVAWLNVAALAAGLASVLLSWRNPAPCATLAGAAYEQCALLFAPVLRIGSMTIVLGLGVLSLLALIAGFNVRLAREGGRSIQAATGMFYLAVILAPAVEFAAKVRFF